MKRRRALMLTTYPVTDASRRLRIEPLVRHLEAVGFAVTTSQLMSDTTFRHKNDGALWRAWGAVTMGWALIRRLGYAVRRYDALIVHREACPLLTPWFERLFATRSRVSLLDVDDAIYESPPYRRDWRRFLRRPERAREFRDVFDVISCGNDALREAFAHGAATTVLYPTCPPRWVGSLAKCETEPLGVLWTGSQSTLQSLVDVLDQIRPVLHSQHLRLYVLGGSNVAELPRDPRVVAAPWDGEAERHLLARCSIGLMPLGESAWESGKSGYKAILCAAAGMEVLVSPVGVNRELAQRYAPIRPVDDGRWGDALAKSAAAVRAQPARPVPQSSVAEDFDADRASRRTIETLLAAYRQKAGGSQRTA